MSDDDKDSIVTLQIGIPTDASGYLRHECPSCMLEFKVKVDEERFTDMVAWWTSRAVAESGLGEGHEQEATSSGQMTCPYCAEPSAVQEFLHGEFRSYLIRVAQREIVEPMLFGMFNDLERTFSRHRRGLVSIRVERGSEARSPRPIAGPDPDDMVRIACALCDERFKLSEGWSGAISTTASGSRWVSGET